MAGEKAAKYEVRRGLCLGMRCSCQVWSVGQIIAAAAADRNEAVADIFEAAVTPGRLIALDRY